MKWSKGTRRQLKMTPFAVNSVFCVHSNAFHTLIYAQQYSVSLGL